ncbi:MAG: 4-hydroxy-3-methylbut-2-enyl diphosphate reductase, partial [Erysipelotrichaceae bacterium]|nr:4-hydroxy-3-methylbut-2-enyl diphosphate reductase [Erysipelotrichaceae bacterium]
MNVIRLQPQGYCGGVLKAIAIAKECKNKYPDQPITVLGNLVHNQYVTEALASIGIRTVDDPTCTRLQLLDRIDAGVVIFTAHGVNDQVYQKAKAKGLIIVDASCPFVLQTQERVNDYCQKGYQVFYIGKYRHPEAESIYLNNERIHLIEKEEDIPKGISGPVFVTNQTTMSVQQLEPLFASIRALYPQAVIQDEICNATRIRQKAVMELDEKQTDCLIVVGDPSSNNTQKLAEIGRQKGIKVHCIQDVMELDDSIIREGQTIALTSGASTPSALTDQIIHY